MLGSFVLLKQHNDSGIFFGAVPGVWININPVNEKNILDLSPRWSLEPWSSIN